MKRLDVEGYFNQDEVVKYYSKAVDSVGLWFSEDIVFSEVFNNKQLKLLELGCGAGRISLALWKKGYSNIIGVDNSPKMVKEAKRLNLEKGFGVIFEEGDAMALKYKDSEFDGIIFGFNGLMQIPKRKNRFKVLLEICRVLKSGGMFVFTTHERNLDETAWYWKEEEANWSSGKQNSKLDEYGDRYYASPEGFVYIHIPTREEIIEDLFAVRFEHVRDVMRSELTQESEAVINFSDECRFWVVRK